MSVSRRHFLGTSSSVLVPFALDPTPLSAGPVQGSTPAPPADASRLPDASFPSHPLALAREMVIAAHGNLAKVKELLDRWPTLARAAIDWGFGDWEDAIGAASHVGNREIAGLLLAHGARPTIFSAAMLGQLEVVKAFVAASPGIEATHGPHSITLLRHAMAGKEMAQPVVEYLKTLPAADRQPPTQPISTEELRALAGTYAFGLDAGDKLAVEANAAGLSIARLGRFPRGLVHVGDRAFYPIGAPSVRIRFGERTGRATLSVHDPDLVVLAERVG